MCPLDWVQLSTSRFGWDQAVLKGRGLPGKVSTPSKPVEVAKDVSHSLTCLGGQGCVSRVDLPWFGCRW
jgi:hypothetical protein